MKEVKVYFKNEDNSIIDKYIDINLVSNYLSMGWTLKKPEKKVEKPISKKENKKEFSKNV